MKRTFLTAGCFLMVTVFAVAGERTPQVLPAPNGITLPEGYRDWRLIAPSHRDDNKTIRAILGNDRAIEAARTGKTRPWLDGAILAKIV